MAQYHPRKPMLHFCQETSACTGIGVSTSRSWSINNRMWDEAWRPRETTRERGLTDFRPWQGHPTDCPQKASEPLASSPATQHGVNNHGISGATHAYIIGMASTLCMTLPRTSRAQRVRSKSATTFFQVVSPANTLRVAKQSCVCFGGKQVRMCIKPG